MPRNDRFWLIMIILFALSMSGGRRPPEPPPPNDDENGDETPGLDVFGIREIHPTAAGGTVWDSEHWSNGRSRILRGSSPFDPDDPTGWSRHKGSSGYRIDGQGTLWLDSSVAGGEFPRFYIDSKMWLNTEVTLYYIRTGSQSGGGISCGVRTVTGSHDPSGDHCLANTYYGRITGSPTYTDFGKELVHADSTFRGKKNMPSLFPRNQWVGFKYVCRNRDNNTKVRLETYLDMTDGINGGDWQRINNIDDAGGWPGGNDLGTGINGGDRELAGCRSKHSSRFPQGNHTIMTGIGSIAGNGGVVFTRNVPARNVGYSRMTVREIDPLP